jgi:hypothetical protein
LGIRAGDPVFIRRVNGWLTIFWVLMIPISLVTGWVSSVVYVSALPLGTGLGHWPAWQAARVEVNQEAEAEKYDLKTCPATSSPRSWKGDHDRAGLRYLLPTSGTFGAGVSWAED